MDSSGTGMQLGAQQQTMQPQLQLQMLQPQMMQPQLQMGPIAQGPVGEQHPLGYKFKISRSVGTVHKVPKCHQVDGIEHMDKKLDSTLTGEMDSDESAVVVWLLSRLKPDFKLTDLRCEYYEELYLKYKHAAERVKDCICFCFLPNHAETVFLYLVSCYN